MRHIVITILCIFTVVNVYGQDWKPYAKQADGCGDCRRFDCVTLMDSTNVQVTQEGMGTFDIRKVVRIQTPAGALRNHVLCFDYDPLSAKASFQYVKIHKTNGQTIDIDASKTYDYAAPARAIYWGARQIMVELGRLATGDIIDYHIQKKGFTYALLLNNEDNERFIPPMRGEFYDIVPFWADEPTMHKVYRVTVPKEKEMQYEFYQGSCASSVRLHGNLKTYTFVSDGIMPIQREPNMPDMYDVAPKLMMSTTPDWKAKSRWFYKVNEDYGSFNATPEAQAKVDALVKGCETEMEKIAVLTHWVADNMRYSGISMGKGEGYTLHNAKTNFTDRCGVCKDKASLLIAMLRMAGFEAYPAMTMAGSRVESIPADHFNHSVAVVKLADGTMMPLDPTWVPFLRELWSSAEQQQNYLPGLPGEGSNLLITPLSTPENHYFRIHVRSKLDAQGTLTGELSVEAEGQSDASVRRIFTSRFRSEWKRNLENELLNVSPEAKLLSVDYGKNPKDYTAAPIKIRMQFTIPNYAIVGDGVMAFKALAWNNLYNSVRTYLRIDTDRASRQFGFKDACSREVTLNESITLPKGFAMTGKAKNDHLKSAAADFSGSLKQEGNTITAYNKLDLKKRVYNASDWDGFRSAILSHKTYGEDIIIEKIK